MSAVSVFTIVLSASGPAAQGRDEPVDEVGQPAVHSERGKRDRLTDSP